MKNYYVPRIPLVPRNKNQLKLLILPNWTIVFLKIGEVREASVTNSLRQKSKWLLTFK